MPSLDATVQQFISWRFTPTHNKDASIGQLRFMSSLPSTTQSNRLGYSLKCLAKCWIDVTLVSVPYKYDEAWAYQHSWWIHRLNPSTNHISESLLYSNLQRSLNSWLLSAEVTVTFATSVSFKRTSTEIFLIFGACVSWSLEFSFACQWHIQ